MRRVTEWFAVREIASVALAAAAMSFASCSDELVPEVQGIGLAPSEMGWRNGLLNRDDRWSITGVDMPSVYEFPSGARINIFGKGFKDGDSIRFAPLEEGKLVSFFPACFPDRASVLMPEGFPDGGYEVQIRRKDSVAVLGIADFKTDNSLVLRPYGVVAHRGCTLGGVPENSLASLRKAVGMGLYGSEFDVWITTDGVPVIHHDPFLEWDGRRIEDMSLKEVRSFKLKNGEKVPTLDEYLAAGAESRYTRLVLEVKEHSSLDNTLRAVEASLAAVKKYKLEAVTDYISFSYEACARILESNPPGLVGYLGGTRSFLQAVAAGCTMTDCYITHYTESPGRISQYEDAGAVTNVWTVDTDAMLSWSSGHGIDLVTTNRPDRALNYYPHKYVEL